MHSTIAPCLISTPVRSPGNSGRVRTAVCERAGGGEVEIERKETREDEEKKDAKRRMHEALAHWGLWDVKLDARRAARRKNDGDVPQWKDALPCI